MVADSATPQQQQQAMQQKHQYVTEVLGIITAVEGEIYKNLTRGIGDKTEQLNSLNTLRKKREDVLKTLIEIYSSEQNRLVSNARVLVDQKTNYKFLEHQIKEADEQLKILKSNKLNQERLAKLGEWEYDRYRSYRNILKVVVYGSLAILIILFAMTNIPFFPSSVGVLGIFLIILIVLSSVINRVYQNMKRRKHNWNKFDFSRFSHNDPLRDTSNEEDTGDRDLAAKCSALVDAARQAATKLATSTAAAAQKEDFTNMIFPETLSRNIEASNSSDYQKYPSLF